MSSSGRNESILVKKRIKLKKQTKPQLSDSQEEKKDRRIPTTRYNPDHQTGLTSQQVQEHRLHGWTNKAVDPPSKTTKEIIHDNIFTYFNLIFIVLAVLLCIVGSFRDLDLSPGYYCQYTDRHHTGSAGQAGSGQSDHVKRPQCLCGPERQNFCGKCRGIGSG